MNKIHSLFLTLSFVLTSSAFANEIPTLVKWDGERVTVQLRSTADAEALYDALQVRPEYMDSGVRKHFVDSGENGKGLEISCVSGARAARCTISWLTETPAQSSTLGYAWSVRTWGADAAALHRATRLPNEFHAGGAHIRSFETEDRFFFLECAQTITDSDRDGMSCLAIAYQSRR